MYIINNNLNKFLFILLMKNNNLALQTFVSLLK